MDLTYAGTIIQSRTYDAIIPLFITTVVCFLIAMLITKLLRIWERRLDIAYKKRKVC